MFVAATAMLFRVRMSLRIGVVLILVNRPAHIVLPLIDLLMLLRRQVTAIRRTIRRNLVIDARLAVLHVRRLMRRHLAGRDSLPDTLLLIRRTHARP